MAHRGRLAGEAKSREATVIQTALQFTRPLPGFFRITLEHYGIRGMELRHIFVQPGPGPGAELRNGFGVHAPPDKYLYDRIGYAGRLYSRAGRLERPGKARGG